MSDFIRPGYGKAVYSDEMYTTDGDSLDTELQQINSGRVVVAGESAPTQRCLEKFDCPPIFGGTAGVTGLPTGTAGDVNVIKTQENVFQYSPKGTQTITAMEWTEAAGLVVAGDATADDGFEITQGVTSASRMAMTAGTDRFFFQTKITVDDVDGTDDLAVGWRKAEAYQAAIDNYDEMAAINMISGHIKLETILNNAATTTTDTTMDLADGEYLIARVEHDHEVGLSSAITLANSIKTKFNLHVSDAGEHTTAIDTANYVTTDDASTLETLLTLVDDLTAKYDAHEGDSELGAAWVYHAAQEAGNVSLAATTAVTTLPAAIKRLNDMKTKFNAHDADGTAHGTDTQHQVTTVSASSTTFKVGVNSATLIAPTVTAPFTFDDGEVVVPFFYFLNDTNIAKPAITHWEVGLL